MASNSFSVEIESVIMYKFAALMTARMDAIPNKSTSLDITPQIRELDMFQSIHTPYIKAEIGVVDPIGLFVNWPMTGEEALIVTFKDIKTQTYSRRYFLIDNVIDISYSDKTRTASYILSCISIEAYANAKQTVQQAYHDTLPNIAQKIFDEYIVARTQKIFPGYVPLPMIKDVNDGLSATLVIPNLSPMNAIKMVADMYVSETMGHDTTIFYQNTLNYRFTTLQGITNMLTRGTARSFAYRNSYKYISDEVIQDQTLMQNDGRIATQLKFNKRFGTLEKLALGHYDNNLFEINIAQKAVFPTRSRIEELTTTLYPNRLNTAAYIAAAHPEGEDNEVSNRVRYVTNIQKENDGQFPVSRLRSKWGKEIQTLSSFAQIDITVTIPGTSMFKAGDLFHMEIPETHGFNEVKFDDLVSGYFLITEVKDIFIMGNYHSTVLRLNKDSYFSSIDRPSRYV